MATPVEYIEVTPRQQWLIGVQVVGQRPQQGNPETIDNMIHGLQWWGGLRDVRELGVEAECVRAQAVEDSTAITSSVFWLVEGTGRLCTEG